MNTKTQARASEGRLVAPPQLIREHLTEQEAFWQTSSAVALPEYELGKLHATWQYAVNLLAEARSQEVPEVLQMPPVPTFTVKARIVEIGPAPFHFIDDLAEDE